MDTITHACVGAITAYFACGKTTLELKPKFQKALLVVGAVAGNLPDIGARESITHTLWAAPLFGLIAAVCMYVLHNKISLLRLWLSMTLAVLIGHLFFDFLTHDTKFLYPFSDATYYLELIRHFDPWVWLPLLAGCVWLFFRPSGGKKAALIAVAFVTLYIGYRGYAKQELIGQLSERYRIPEAAITAVPVYYGFMNVWNPMEWLQYYYVALGEKRDVVGMYSIAAGTHKPIWDLYMLIGRSEPNPQNINPFMQIVYEKEADGQLYLVCGPRDKANPDKAELRVFQQRLSPVSEWSEVEGVLQTELISEYESSTVN